MRSHPSGTVLPVTITGATPGGHPNHPNDGGLSSGGTRADNEDEDPF
jgi:hypothetical protein